MSSSCLTLEADQIRAFREQGYLVVPKVIPQTEVEHLIETFMAVHAAGPVPPFFNPVPLAESGGDILKAYPRIVHPHRFNDVALRYLLDPRLAAILQDLFDEEPLAAQSMLYFKPPGARGQALHQDNFYLRVEPGTCIAAWIPLDPADAGNGGLKVVPGSHQMDLVCPDEADPELSFANDYVPVPEGLEVLPLTLDAGDVLFFNGSVIHGSDPNRTTDRFRRSFICHYVGRSSQRLSAYYRPILTMQGKEVEVEVNIDGGPCGAEEAIGPH